MNHRLNRVCVRLLTGWTLFLVGCGGGSDSDRFRRRVDLVKSERSDTVDARSTRVITDGDLTILVDVPNIRHLILDNCPITDVGLESIRGLSELETLSLSGTLVTDAGLQHLAGLGKLRFLRLDQLPITDIEMRHIARLKTLRTLSLWKTRITGSAVEQLAALPELVTLSLDETRIEASDLRHFHKNSKLKHLSLWHTTVTPEAIRALEIALPNLNIKR